MDAITETEEPLLSVRNLAVHFPLDEGLVKAVDGVSFDVRGGRTTAIVGESGCGKSMTARAILRILDKPGRIVDGQILWRGGGRLTDITALKPGGKEIRALRWKDISLIFQEPMTSFSPVHTIGNQIMEAVRLHSDLDKKAIRQRAIKSLRDVGIPEPELRIDYYPYQLSGGLRQRAMIAMALVCNPDLVIADEPTTALDVTTQAQILDLLMDLQKRHGMAIIIITHDLGVVAQMADDVVVMYLGRVVEQGPVDDIFHNPKHPYTRALLRSTPQMRMDKGEKLATIEGSIPHPFERPPGCPFHNRCADFMKGTCDVREPMLQPIGDQQVSCFLYEESEPVSREP